MAARNVQLPSASAQTPEPAPLVSASGLSLVLFTSKTAACADPASQSVSSRAPTIPAMRVRAVVWASDRMFLKPPVWGNAPRFHLLPIPTPFGAQDQFGGTSVLSQLVESRSH